MVPSPALLQALDRPGPRYTSYPTVPTWTTDVTEADLVAALAAVAGPASVYVHIPFCKEQCWFCGCNQVVSSRQDAGDRYLDRLERELGLLRREAPLELARLHLGGGTPTWLDERQLDRLFDLVGRLGRPSEGAELSVELDPDVTTQGQIDLLASRGVNRISVGVQSTDPTVLAAIHRPQDTAKVRACLARARHHRMRGINVDLVYGLPHQTAENLRATLRDVLDYDPDRFAVYSYAHVPWSKRHQQNIDAALLPTAVDKLALFLLTEEVLLDAGYVRVGMDHFAKRDDALGLAAAAGTLHRNFMGYTTRADLPLLGLGVSAISEFAGLYTQAQTHLGSWNRAIDAGAGWIERGIRLTERDRVVKDAISALMCNFHLDVPALERRHGISFADFFPRVETPLRALEAEGLVTLDADAIRVTDLGLYLVRNVAMVFDERLGPNMGFSRTV